MKASATALGRHLQNHTRGDGLKARLIRGGLGSAGIQAVSRLLVLALGIVLARTLGAAGYGVYAYAFAIMSLLMVLAEAGVPDLLMREIAAAGARAEWGLLRGALRRGRQFVGLVAVSVAFAGLMVLWWRAPALSPPVFYTTALMLLVLPVAALSKTTGESLRGLHYVVTGQAVTRIIRPALVLALVGAGFFIWPNLREPQYAMAAQLVGVVAALLVATIAVQCLRPAQSKAAVPEYRSRVWLKSALPFTLIGGANVINNHADIIMLGWFASSAQVGIYRVAVQGASLVAFALQAANAVVAPQFAQLHARGDVARLQRLVTQNARVVFLAALPVALAFIGTGGVIAGAVFGSAFAAAHLPLAILVAGQLVNAAMGSVGFLLNMTGHERRAARTVLQTALLNVALNGLLIPFYGIAGAAGATAVALAVRNVQLYRYARDQLGICSTAFRFKPV